MNVILLAEAFFLIHFWYQYFLCCEVLLHWISYLCRVLNEHNAIYIKYIIYLFYCPTDLSFYIVDIPDVDDNDICFIMDCLRTSYFLCCSIELNPGSLWILLYNILVGK